MGASSSSQAGTDLEWFAYWKDYCENWLLSLGIKKEHLRLRDHEPAELAFLQPCYHRYQSTPSRSPTGASWGALRTVPTTT